MSRTTRLGPATVITFLMLLTAPSPVSSANPGRAEAIRARLAIEEVYWRHTIWPESNPTPKPEFDRIVDHATIERRVDDMLLRRRALTAQWGRVATPSEVQRELNRMAVSTRSPEVLRELFAALGDDPALIAETLARPQLEERWIEHLYAIDPELHAATRRAADGALSAVRGGKTLRSASVPWERVVYVPRGGEATPGAVEVDDTAWSELNAEALDAPLALRNDGDAFWTRKILSRSPRGVVADVARWPKRSLESWLAENARFASSPSSRATIDYAYELPQITASACTDDTWRTLAVSSTPPPRQEHRAVWAGTQMILVGGNGPLGGADIGADARYDQAGDSWLSVSATGRLIRARGHTAVWTGSKVVVWGGVGPGGANTNSGARYDPATDTWTTMSTVNPPTARTGHAAIWTGSRMIVWGGGTQGGSYDPVNDLWTVVPQAGTDGARFDHSAVWTGSRMLIWGGRIGSTILNTGWSYEPISTVWTPINASGAPAARKLHAGQWAAGRMVVWSGLGTSAQSSALNDGGRYDPGTDTWATMSTAGAPDARSNTESVTTGTKLIGWGGYNANGGLLPSGGVYDPTADSWVATSLVSAPTNRVFHSAVWTGSRMIVYGGFSLVYPDPGPVSTEYADDGVAYDPVTDTWDVIAAGSARGVRRSGATSLWNGSKVFVFGGGSGAVSNWSYDPALDSWNLLSGINAQTSTSPPAVWTGSRMIAWGNVSTNTGRSYDPIADTWTSLSVFGAPTARTNHTMVWTGSRMLLWGGTVSGTGSVADGKSYDPTMDSWAPISTLNAPPPMSGHGAVWTGSRMVVWSGIGAIGGVYNPTNDTWTQVNPTGAPSARSGETTLWTGKEMIVWGGQFSGTRFNTGGRYNPSTNTWSATSTVGAPVARISHTAVWAENAMLIWGGNVGGSNDVNSGARYDPKLDVWSPMSTSGAPTAREGHESIWTGSEMLGFGGSPLTSNSGSYCFVCPQSTVYRDADGDGFGSSGTTMQACAPPPGWVEDSTDCDDTNASSFPGAPELCDGKDNDCAGGVPANEADADGDGVRICGNDCNDGSPAIHPGAVDTCNGIDDDCSGQFDDDALGVDSDGDSVRNACDNCRLAPNTAQTDVDQDSVGNACDNCITTPNANQADADGDLRGNVCDNCPLVSNITQDDGDVDRVGDACDNCLFDYNASQSDFNNDGEGDVCDLDDGLIYIFSTDKTFVEWQQESGPSSWNVYEGDLAVLRATGVYTQTTGSNPLADRHCGVLDAFVADPEVPAAGGVKFSLVTGVTGGVEGSLGSDSHGIARPNTNACP